MVWEWDISCWLLDFSYFKKAENSAFFVSEICGIIKKFIRNKIKFMTEEIKKNGDSESTEDKAFAAIGYIGVLCFIPLFLKKDSVFVQFHAKQGLVLFIAWVISCFFNILPFVGWVAASVAYIALLILSVIGFVHALSGRYWKMPYLSEYAEKIKL